MPAPIDFANYSTIHLRHGIVRIEDKTATHCSIVGTCVFTKEAVKLENVPYSGLQLFLDGEKYIQQCFPDMHEDDREFLQSGISAKGWTKKFGPST